jgi:hypothetical protein
MLGLGCTGLGLFTIGKRSKINPTPGKNAPTSQKNGWKAGQGGTPYLVVGKPSRLASPKVNSGLSFLGHLGPQIGRLKNSGSVRLNRSHRQKSRSPPRRPPIFSFGLPMRDARRLLLAAFSHQAAQDEPKTRIVAANNRAFGLSINSESSAFRMPGCFHPGERQNDPHKAIPSSRKSLRPRVSDCGLLVPDAEYKRFPK